MRLLSATLLHPLVDACSATVLVAGGFTWRRSVVYNALAFALQLPLGVFLDLRPSLLRPAFAAGIGMTLCGVAVCLAGSGDWLPLVSACIGNALFHITAGKSVLDGRPGRSGPSGVFIATGALGLFAGLRFGRDYTLPCAVGFGSALAVLAFLSWRNDRFAVPPPVAPNVRGWLGATALAALFGLVAWRSWAGILASAQTGAAGFAFACAGAAATWAGKTAGGHLADKFGRAATVAGSVAASVALCFCCRPDRPVLWLVLLFSSQLATGPVLSWLYAATGRAGGTAFGVNCMGLFAGSLR